MHTRSHARKQFVADPFYGWMERIKNGQRPYTYTLRGWNERINEGRLQPVGTFAADALDGYEEYSRDESQAGDPRAYDRAVKDMPDRLCKRYKFRRVSRKDKQELRVSLSGLYALFIKDFPPPFIDPRILLVDVTPRGEIKFLAQDMAALAHLSAHFGMQRRRLRPCVCCDRAFIIDRWDRHRRSMCDRCVAGVRPNEVIAWNLPPRAEHLWKKAKSQMRMRFRRRVAQTSGKTFREWSWKALADLVNRLRDDPKCDLEEWREKWIPTVRRGRPRKIERGRD